MEDLQGVTLHRDSNLRLLLLLLLLLLILMMIGWSHVADTKFREFLMQLQANFLLLLERQWP